LKLTYLIAFLYLGIGYAVGQDYPRKEIDLSRLVEDLVGFQDQDADYEEIYENLVQILTNPIDLNTASAEQLRILHILSEKQIQQLIHYRNTQGRLISIYELQAIPNFDLPSVYKLLPFVRVMDPKNQLNTSLTQRMFAANNGYLLTRYERTLETKEGFNKQKENADKIFKGSADRQYLRFRTSKPGDFSLGFTGEKDAGEQFLWSPSKKQYGFDFISAHAQIINKGKLKNLIVGDFQCQFAQGLILGNAFGLGKGAETITTTRRSNIGFLPYSSVNESGFYRGASATFEVKKNILVSTFYSHTNRDASIQENETNGTSISAFQFTGLHRNETEIDKRKKIEEQSYGFVLNYSAGRVDGGLILHGIDFGQPVYKTPSVYNRFTFSGTRNTSTGVFLNYTVNNITFFSEAARSAGGGIGAIAGVLGSIHKNLDISMVYRKYAKSYYSFYANPFSENSQPQNETGFYWGWKYNWKRKYTLAGYTDLFKFPWLGYRRYAPSEGYEWLLRASYQPSRKILMYVQAREESKARNFSGNQNLYQINQGIKKNYWFNVDYGISEHLKLKTRAQLSTYTANGHTSKGVVLLQDINFNFGRFEISARHALFDTDDFDNRQYVYENDVWMAFSLPAYYGVGIRNYLLLQCKVSKSLSLWMRYSRTRYTDRDEIGAGLDAIAGNIRNDLKFQALFRF
jgi:hypothetical protein